MCLHPIRRLLLLSYYPSIEVWISQPDGVRTPMRWSMMGLSSAQTGDRPRLPGLILRGGIQGRHSYILHPRGAAAGGPQRRTAFTVPPVRNWRPRCRCGSVRARCRVAGHERPQGDPLRGRAGAARRLRQVHPHVSPAPCIVFFTLKKNGCRDGRGCRFLPVETSLGAARACRHPCRYLPELDEELLLPSYSGVRTKVAGKGQPPGDFLISGPAVHGHRGLVNLFGIESPGLTSCLAIAKHVAKELRL